MLFFYSLIFILATLVLVRAGFWLVRSLISVARFMNWSQFLTAFILVGIGTSLPELFVGVGAALKGVSPLSVGDVLGSNVLNLTFVAGIVIMISRGVQVRNKLTRREAWIIFALGLLPVLALLNKTLSRWEGLALILAFVGYLVYLVKTKKTLAINGKMNKFRSFKGFVKSWLIFVLSLVLLLVSALVVSFSAQKLAVSFGLSLVSAGLFLVAIGTSLPELIFGIRAVLSHHEEMNVGSLLGSCAANSCLVLGIVSLISPAVVSGFSFLVPASFMLATLLVFGLFISSRSFLHWWEGLLLFLFYLIFLGVNLIF